MIARRMVLAVLTSFTSASLANAASPENEVGILLKEGRYLEETVRDLSSAIEKFKQVQKVINAEPRSLAISDLAVARCIMKKGNYSEARQRLNLVMYQYPQFPSMIVEAQGLLQRIPESNPAKFMPPDSLAYLELTQPWAQMERLARLLDEGGVLEMLKRQPLDPSLALFQTILGTINMKRLPEIKKIEAFGVGLLDLTGNPKDETSPPASQYLLVLYPGQSDWYKSIIKYIRGTRKPLEQHLDFEIYKLPTRKREIVLALGKEAILFGSDLSSVVDGIYRAHDGDKLTLADDPDFRRQSAARRRDSAIIAYSNLSRLVPILKKASNRKNLEMLDALLDLDSVSNLMARVDLDDDHIAVELTAMLKKDRVNSFYRVWKSESLDREALNRIPQDAVGALSMTLQERDRRWQEAFGLFDALYSAKWQESPGIDFIGIVDGIRMLLGSERGKQLLENIHSLTFILTESDSSKMGARELFDDLVLLVHVKDARLVKGALEELSDEYLRRSKNPEPPGTSLIIQNEKSYRLADTGPIRIIVQKEDWVLASSSPEGMRACLEAMHSGRCLGDLPSNDPLRQIPSKVNKFGFLRFDRVLERLIGKETGNHIASLSQALPIVFTTLEKPSEVVIRVDANKLNAMVGHIAAALFGLSYEPDSLTRNGFERTSLKGKVVP